MSAALQVHTFQSSELSRQPAAVFAAAEDGPVLITRRDGEPLILTSEAQARQDQLGLELAAQLVAASLDSSTEPFTARLLGPFPWLMFLEEAEREAFAQEIVSVARACAAVRHFDRLLKVLEEWHRTAQAYAAGYTADMAVDWLEDDEAAADPRADVV